MKRFIEGVERTQSTLFPALLDEYIAEDNGVRVIDAFIDSLNLKALGFDGAMPANTRRPSYHPAILLKMYVYGYLNRIQSSRRLEREAQRNVELMWLTNRLTPDFKTIADFRKDNGVAIRNVCKRFILLCHQLSMFEAGEVAIDGSKFRAVNNRDKNYTQRKIKARIEQVEDIIARYMDELERADRQPDLTVRSRVDHIKQKIDSFKRQIAEFNALAQQLQNVPDQQISETDPDARSMATSGRGAEMVGYNVQTALEIQACEQQGITPLVPKPVTSNNRALGLFDKRDFIYLVQRNEYVCPAGQRAQWRFKTVERGEVIHKYWTSACPTYTLKPHCTTGDYRRITRWEQEEVLERMQQRLNERPELAMLRRCTVEHPFGTLKAWMGATHFLTKTLPKVRVEMSLHILAYNMKRMMQMLGTAGLLEAMRR